MRCSGCGDSVCKSCSHNCRVCGRTDMCNSCGCGEGHQTFLDLGAGSGLTAGVVWEEFASFSESSDEEDEPSSDESTDEEDGPPDLISLSGGESIGSTSPRSTTTAGGSDDPLDDFIAS